MAKRRNPKRVNDPALDLITGRIVLASESVRKQFEQRLLTAIAEIGIGPHSEEAIANVVREYLRIYEPILADNLGNSLILTWLASYVESVSELPPNFTGWFSWVLQTCFKCILHFAPRKGKEEGQVFVFESFQ